MEKCVKSLKGLCALICLLCCLSLTTGALANPPLQFIERPDSEYLILGANINGSTRNNGVEAYLPEQSNPSEVLVPLGVLCDALSYAIEVDSGDGIAHGWIGEEANTFELNLQRREVIYSGKKETFSDGVAEPHVDDIYVNATYLEKWLNLTISLDLSQLVLDVSSKGVLPFEAQKVRANQAKQMLGRQRISSVDDKKAKMLPYSFFTFPSLSLQENVATVKGDDGVDIQTQSSVQGNFDFLKLGAYFNLGYRTNTEGGNDITDSEVTFQRRDPRKKLLGPLKAGRYAVGDVTFPSIPLLSGQKRGAGMVVSSDSNLGYRFTDQTSDYLIEGDATPGWDAEIYRNGHFIDFQQVGTDGRFEFNGVDLIDGFNLFEIVLYGPEGQKETVTREVFRGANMLRPNEMYYTMAAGMPESDFLPFAENSQDNSEVGVSGEFLYGVNNNLTLGASAYTGPNDDEDISSASFTAATALGPINAQGRYLIVDNNRSGYEALARTRFGKTNLSFNHTSYDGFDSDDQDIETETGITISRNFGKMNTSFSSRKISYLDRANETEYENITSTNIFGTKFTNTLKKVDSEEDSLDSFEGSVAVQTNAFGNTRLRGDANYNLDSDENDDLFRSFQFSSQTHLDDNRSFRVGGTYTVDTDTLNADVRYSQDVGEFALDFSASGSTEDVYSFGVGMRTSIKPEYETDYRFLHPEKGNQATVGVRTFLDTNDNNIFDGDDKPIKDVDVQTNRGNISGTTRDDGVTWLHGLTESPTRLSIDLASVDSIDTTPVNNDVDIIPRKGANSIIEFPFKQLGEVDGFVRTFLPDSNGKNGIKDATITLISIKDGNIIAETSTESDGFYFISALPLGEYKVIVTINKYTKPEHKEALFTLTSEVPNKLNLDFIFGNENQSILPSVTEEEHTIVTNNIANRYGVHIASLRNKNKANREAERLETRYLEILTSGNVNIVPISIGDGEIHYRIIVAPLSIEKSKEICSKLEKEKNPGGCYITIYPR